MHASSASAPVPVSASARPSQGRCQSGRVPVGAGAAAPPQITQYGQAGNNETVAQGDHSIRVKKSLPVPRPAHRRDQARERQARAGRALDTEARGGSAAPIPAPIGGESRQSAPYVGCLCRLGAAGARQCLTKGTRRTESPGAGDPGATGWEVIPGLPAG